MKLISSNNKKKYSGKIYSNGITNFLIKKKKIFIWSKKYTNDEIVYKIIYI